MKTLNYSEAMDLLKEYNSEDFHIRHAKTVEGCMRYFAKKLGYGEEEEFWAICGLLHDLDFEKYPDQHCTMNKKILEEMDIDPKMVHCILSHGWGLCSDVKPESEMEKILYAVDELTGLVWATSLMRPSKSVQDLPVKSVKKKFKDKRFAAGCDREVIMKGTELLGWTLDDLIENTILAMREYEEYCK